MSDYIYEICDTSNDEMYFPLGIFATFSDAKAALLKVKNNPATETGQNEDFEQIKIIKREFGWSGHGKEMLVINRERKYSEKGDEYLFTDIDEAMGD